MLFSLPICCLLLLKGDLLGVCWRLGSCKFIMAEADDCVEDLGPLSCQALLAEEPFQMTCHPGSVALPRESSCCDCGVRVRGGAGSWLVCVGTGYHL